MASHRTPLVALQVFLLNAYLVSSSFLPNLGGISTWDESVYVNSGRMLLQGEWPSFAGNPLVAILYALTYLPYAQSGFWLVHSASLGRMILFALVWLSGYAVATQLARWAHPLVTLGFFFVSSIPLALLNYPSDPLFVGMAAFSFWKILSFHNSGRLSDLGFSSFFLGLAALARNDGLLMGASLVLLAVVVGYGRVKVWAAILAAAAPFAAVVFGYLLIYGSFTGDYQLGTLARTYDNFEAGQQVVFSGKGIVDPVLEAKLEARRLFGNPDENGNSVLRAIQRNPAAYMERLVAIARQLPGTLLGAYGQRAAAIVLLLALRGAWDLWRQRERRLLLVFLLWPAHLASGFVITLFRPGHLRFPFYIVYALAAIGVTALVVNRKKGGERAMWVAALLVVGVYSVLVGASAVQFGVVAFAAGLALVFWAWPEVKEGSSTRLAPALGLVFLSIGLLLHGDFSGPKVRTLGERPDEQAVLFMEETFEPGTRIAAGSPGPIYAARMTYMGLTSLDVPAELGNKAFLDWMRGQGIEAVYVDTSLTLNNPGLWEKISASIGFGLERIFAAGDGDFQVLEVLR